MYNSSTAVAQPLQSFSSASITSSYQAIGTPLVYPARIVYITNNSTQDITLSWDGINDHDYIPHGVVREYDVGSMRGSAPALDIPKGINFYAKGTAGTGSIYVTAISAYTPQP